MVALPQLMCEGCKCTAHFKSQLAKRVVLFSARAASSQAATWALTMEAGEKRELRRRQLSVAVIGAGAAGLVATHELRKEGHRVVVFEQQSDGVGGVWRYTEQVDGDDDPRGSGVVHSSMYLSLRTNLPREIMGYFDYPFLAKHQDCNRDSRRYPSHAEVLSYLEDFAVHFGILPCICFGRRITSVSIHKSLTAPAQSLSSQAVESMQWSVVSEAESNGLDVTTDIFDAVVICNGHYFQPKLASIPGIDKWPGKQLHSHNYRVPDPFVDQMVVMIGNSSSGSDISRDIATVAKEVHLVGRSWDASVDMGKPAGLLQNIVLHPMVKSAHENGKIVFEDGVSVIADTILYCTGYAYSVPFLQKDGAVNVDCDYIGPLYQHVFPPILTPTLSFVGLPFKVIPFPLMQLQSKWIAMCLSGKALLPSKQHMSSNAEEFYEGILAKGTSKSKIHDLSTSQFEYDNWLASQCGCEHIEPWRIQIYLNSSRRKHAFPDTYRDEWTDQDLHDTAVAHLSKLTKSN